MGSGLRCGVLEVRYRFLFISHPISNFLTHIPLPITPLLKYTFENHLKTMNNILTIDIGNTNITVGAFKGKRLVKKTNIPTHNYFVYEKSLDKFIKSCGFNGKCSAVISSVVPEALPYLVNVIRKKKCRIVIVGKDKKVPIPNLYKKKLEVGQDRLVNAYSAKVLYGAPCVIIDLGTAITFDIVSRKGEYLGGLILPGIELSLRSLYERTALLPKVVLRPSANIIGKDTVNSMRAGILFGFGAMCDGLVSEYRKILGANTEVIATGGNARLMKRYAKSIQTVDPDLTLKGLRLLATE